MAIFNIGKDFSRDPAGRYYADGDGCGERFREEFLKTRISSLAEGEKLIIVLDDGVETYGSSFLSEGFGGMVKHGYCKAQDLLEKLEFRYEDPDFKFYESKIKQYISDTKYNSKEYKSTK